MRWQVIKMEQIGENEEKQFRNFTISTIYFYLFKTERKECRETKLLLFCFQAYLSCAEYPLKMVECSKTEWQVV